MLAVAAMLLLGVGPSKSPPCAVALDDAIGLHMPQGGGVGKAMDRTANRFLVEEWCEEYKVSSSAFKSWANFTETGKNHPFLPLPSVRLSQLFACLN